MSNKLVSNEEVTHMTISTDFERSDTGTGNSERDVKIRLRAYELYLARGQEFGQELDDWLQAEREIVNGLC